MVPHEMYVMVPLQQHPKKPARYWAAWTSQIGRNGPSPNTGAGTKMESRKYIGK